jgi:hypothetical protein
MPQVLNRRMNRRAFLPLAGSLASAPLWFPRVAAADNSTGASPVRGRAEHCVFLWLGGGMAQIDTFDPKAVGDSSATPKKAGSQYPSIETAVPGVRVCEHLSRTATVMDRLTVLRSVHHQVVDEHAFAISSIRRSDPWWLISGAR